MGYTILWDQIDSSPTGLTITGRRPFSRGLSMEDGPDDPDAREKPRGRGIVVLPNALQSRLSAWLRVKDPAARRWGGHDPRQTASCIMQVLA